MKFKLILSLIIILIITMVGIYFYFEYKTKMLAKLSKQVDNYTLIKEIPADLPDSEVRLYKHNKTQATVVYFYNPNEDNNVFSVGFRTTPFDNTGVFHILEHSVLEGSKNFPVKGDLYYELDRSYIITFLNAMTSQDRTTYPIASTNKASFVNLSNAYMDSVFSPLIKQEPAIFYREGVRKDFDEKGNLIYNGIVYNEMLANINKYRTISNQLFKNLLPNSEYSYNSGGDPEFIPDLTYEKFIETYNKFYHPSNSLIYFYGNVDLKERLEYLDQNYLSQYEYLAPEIPAISTIEDTPNPTPVTDYYPAEPTSDIDKDSSIILGYVTDFESYRDGVALSIMLRAIFNSEASSYRKEILSKCGCKDISAAVDTIQKPVLFIHIEGVSPKNLASVKDALDTLFNKISDQGIDKDLLRSVITKYLFSLKNITSSNLGIDRYLATIYRAWINTQDPFSYLNEDKIIEDLQNTLEKDSSYFTTLLKTNIISNNKQYIGIVSPSTTVLPEKQKRISTRLKQEQTKLTQEDKDQIKKTNEAIKQLSASDSSESDSSFKLPSLSESDLVKNEYKFSLLPNKESFSFKDIDPNLSKDITLFTYDSLYDDIDHLYILFGLSHLSDEDFVNLSLLDTLLQRISTQNYSSEKLNQAINLYGNISSSINFYLDKDKKYHFYYRLTLDSLPENMNHLLDLGLETLYNTIFTDKDKIKQILNETLYDIEQSINIDPLGSGYLSILTTSSLSSGSYINNFIKGKYFIKRLKTITKDFDGNFDSLVSSLKSVSDKVFKSNIPMVGVVSKSNEGVSRLKEDIFNKNNKKKLLSCMNLSSSSSLHFDPIIRKDSTYSNTGYIIPQNTSYSRKTFNLSDIDPKIEITGDFIVLQQYINKYLTNKIRLESGAYGSYMNLSKSGVVAFYSYRDPNIDNTNKIFSTITTIFKNQNLTEQDEFIFKVASISAIDYPSTPKGYSMSSIDRFLSGETEQDVYKLRDEILNTSLNKFMADKADLFEKALKTSKFSTAAGKDMLNKNKKIYSKIVPLVEE